MVPDKTAVVNITKIPASMCDHRISRRAREAAGCQVEISSTNAQICFPTPPFLSMSSSHGTSLAPFSPKSFVVLAKQWWTRCHLHLPLTASPSFSGWLFRQTCALSINSEADVRNPGSMGTKLVTSWPNTWIFHDSFVLGKDWGLRKQNAIRFIRSFYVQKGGLISEIIL